MIVLKFLVYFCISFFILSIPISNQNIFSHLSSITDPYTAPIFAQIGSTTKEGYNKGKKYIGNLFTSSAPKEKKPLKAAYKIDRKRKQDSPGPDAPNDSYTVEERELIKNLLKKAQY